MNKGYCEGCNRRVFFDDMKHAVEPYYTINKKSNDFFNDGKWEWTCKYTKTGIRTFKTCPCLDCLIKSIYHTECEEFETTTTKYGSYNKSWFLK